MVSSEIMPPSRTMFSSNVYATFVVGFAIMTDSMIYTLVLPFLPTLFAKLHVPERQTSQWTALAFEAFAVATLSSNAVVGLFANASASKSRSFLISVIIMFISTIIFFVGASPVTIVLSRAIQGVSTTFTWVTGLAFLVDQVGEDELGTYVGWTTVGVAIGEIVGPLVGGPIYEHLGHWAAFGIVEALLLFDILLRVFAKEKKPDTKTGTAQDTEVSAEQDSETDRLLPDERSDSTDYNTVYRDARAASLRRSVVKSLACNWLGTVFTLVVVFMVRGALEVALPLYLTRQYGWTPTSISFALFTLTLPAAFNPVVGKFTSRHGPRWWSTGAFTVCGAAMISFGNVSGHSKESKVFFLVHSAVIGIALAVLVNSNQVAISVASQRFSLTMSHAKDNDANLGWLLSLLNPSMILSGVTTSWAAGILLGPAYSSLIAFTEDRGWAIFCRGLGGLCLVAALGSSFLWRKW